MEVINARSALLSNYEVLELLRELENDHLTRTKTALRIKKEEESSGNPTASGSVAAGGKDPTVVEVSENLRTVEVEAIQYLSASYQPISSQTAASIEQLVRDLAPYNLTKAEKLQMVNLAPTEAPELYTIIEEIEDRIGIEAMEEILAIVTKSLNAHPPPPTSTTDSYQNAGEQDAEIVYLEDQWDPYADADAVADDIQFDDMGEGAGVEGDLDVDDD